MVLKRQPSPAFESEDNGDQVTMINTADQPVATPSVTATAVVPPKPAGKLALQSQHNMDAVKNLKNMYPVNYDSLAQVIAGQGRFSERESKTNLGSELVFELMSYQDQFVVSPNDDKAPKDLVRYSSDGVVCSDGTLVADHLAELKSMNWKNARVNQRYILVGALISAEKSDKFNGTLMQIDLASKSKGQFDRYLIQSAYAIGKGRITEDGAKVVKLVAEVVSNSMNQQYTLVKFFTHAE